MAAIMIVVVILFLAAGCRCFLSDAFKTVYAGQCDRINCVRSAMKRQNDEENGEGSDNNRQGATGDASNCSCEVAEKNKDGSRKSGSPTSGFQEKSKTVSTSERSPLTGTAGASSSSCTGATQSSASATNDGSKKNVFGRQPSSQWTFVEEARKNFFRQVSDPIGGLFGRNERNKASKTGSLDVPDLPEFMHPSRLFRPQLSKQEKAEEELGSIRPELYVEPPSNNNIGRKPNLHGTYCSENKKDPSNKNTSAAASAPAPKTIASIHSNALLPSDPSSSLLPCGAAGPAKTSGHLFVSLMYSTMTEGLVIKVQSAAGLTLKSGTKQCDPYVRLYILPDRKFRAQTRLQKKTTNPSFNEVFEFKMSYPDLGGQKIQFWVYSHDRFSRDEVVGLAEISNLTCNTGVDKDTLHVLDIVSLAHRKPPDLGDLLLSLCYLPAAGRLTVTAVKARRLKPMDISGSADPYVKAVLVQEGKRIKKRKTSVKKTSLNPVFNESLVFEIATDQNAVLEESTHLLVSVIDHDRVGRNELMGCVALGPNVDGLGRDQWTTMMSRPRRPVTQWHSLAPAFPPELVPDRTSPYYPSIPTSFQDNNLFVTLGTNIRNLCAEGTGSPDCEQADKGEDKR